MLNPEAKVTALFLEQLWTLEISSPLAPAAGGTAMPVAVAAETGAWRVWGSVCGKWVTGNTDAF